MVSGLKYRDGSRTPEGLQSIVLKPGPTGKAKITAKGGREYLQLAPMPLGLPVRAQLQASTGECWEATYSSPTFNAPGGFTAAAD